jgi:glyoxylase-like metal-dependent hydrolase (beta-lactamase superfamily II)
MIRSAIFLLSLGLAAQSLPVGLQFSSGPINTLRLPGGVAIYGDPRATPREVWVTHARRDVLWAAEANVAAGAALTVPEVEARQVTDAGKFWSLFRQTRFHDYAQRSTKLPVDSLAVARTVKGGDRLTAGEASVEVMDTPGYSAGAVSYLIASGGKRIAATGDLIYSGGRLLEIYSLQDAIPETKTRGYHGYAARAGQLILSLKKLQAWKPDVIVPARGPMITQPSREIDLLIGRLQSLLDSHFATDALRWYWGEESWKTRATLAMGKQPGAPMPMAPERDLPAWVIAIENSRLIVSSSGQAFLLDAGHPKVFEKLEELHAAGRFKSIEGIWITHYHDDHTDYVGKVAARWKAPVHYSDRIRDIIERPASYRMPALTHVPSTGKAHADGERWKWREYTLTSYDFPGQTLYHGGLTVESGAVPDKLFFVGDSFTPSGLDDYCLLNRNFVGENEGYLYCLRLIEKLGGQHWLINQHVAPMFRYDPERLARMRAELRKRAELLAAITPLPGANFAVDEGWARVYPYSVKPEPGTVVELVVEITNHAAKRTKYDVQWHVPKGWQLVESQGALTLDPRATSRAKARIRRTADAAFGVLTADVTVGGFALHRWVEALLEVE